MSFGFMVAGFLATTNAARVALAHRVSDEGGKASIVPALLAGAALIVVAAAFADELLDALTISPESFRIAAGLVLAATGLLTLVWPRVPSGPFAAVLVTPELACLALSLGADEALGRVLAAAAIALPAVPIAAMVGSREPTMALATRFLAALQIVIAVALVVSGLRDV